MNLPAWAEELLSHSRIAYLATADSQGQPLGVVICFVFDGSVFYSVVDGKPKKTRSLRRLRNIEQNPQVSLTVNHYDEDWTVLRHVIVEGHAEVLETGEERAAAIGTLREKYPQYRLTDDESFAAAIRIDPTRFLSWSAAG